MHVARYLKAYYLLFMQQRRKSKRSTMDTYSSKRGVASSRAPRKGVGSGDANSAQDQNVQFCNRIGCSGRIKYANQNAKIGSSEKAKSSKSALSSSNGSGVIEASSRSGGSVMIREKTSHLDSKRKLSSQSGFDQSQSSQSGDSEARIPTIPHHSGTTNEPGKNTKTGVVQSSVRSRKKIQCASNSNKQKTLTASAVSSSSKSSVLGTLSGSSSSSSNSGSNRKCAVPPSSSSSGSKSLSKNVTKKRNIERDSDHSSRGRQTTIAATSGVLSSSSSGSSSVSDSRRSNCTSAVESSVSSSARSGGSANVNKSRVRLSYRQNGRNTLSFRESSEPPRNVGRTRLSQQYSANASSSGSSSYNLSSSNDDSRSTLMPYTSAEPGYSHFMNRETLQRYNMEGIAEVLFLVCLEFKWYLFV